MIVDVKSDKKFHLKIEELLIRFKRLNIPLVFITQCYFTKYYKINNLDSITNENNKEHNEKWPYIPDHPYRIIIIGGSGSGKTNALINLINEQNDIDKICMQEI